MLANLRLVWPEFSESPSRSRVIESPGLFCPELLTSVYLGRSGRHHPIRLNPLGMFKTEQPTQIGHITVGQ